MSEHEEPTQAELEKWGRDVDMCAVITEGEWAYRVETLIRALRAARRAKLTDNRQWENRAKGDAAQIDGLKRQLAEARAECERLGEHIRFDHSMPLDQCTIDLCRKDKGRTS